MKKIICYILLIIAIIGSAIRLGFDSVNYWVFLSGLFLGIVINL